MFVCCVNEEGCGSNVEVPWIREHYTFLVDNLESVELINYLYQMEVINSKELDSVRAMPASAKKNERLLTILERKSHEKIQPFFTALDITGQSHIRNQILGQQAGIAQNMTLICLLMCPENGYSESRLFMYFFYLARYA